jgi:hypothetical protein
MLIPPFGGFMQITPTKETLDELLRLASLSRSFRQSLTNRVFNASLGQLTNTKNLMTIAVFHRRLTTLVPNAVSQILDLAQKLSEGYSQVQRYTLLQNLLDSDADTNCVDRGIQLLPRHYCAAGQIGIYGIKWLLLPSMAHYNNHSILASIVDGIWRFLIHLPRYLLPLEANGGGEVESLSPAANPSLPARKGNARRFRSIGTVSPSEKFIVEMVTVIGLQA